MVLLLTLLIKYNGLFSWWYEISNKFAVTGLFQAYAAYIDSIFNILTVVFKIYLLFRRLHWVIRKVLRCFKFRIVRSLTIVDTVYYFLINLFAVVFLKKKKHMWKYKINVWKGKFQVNMKIFKLFWNSNI